MIYLELRMETKLFLNVRMCIHKFNDPNVHKEKNNPYFNFILPN